MNLNLSRKSTPNSAAARLNKILLTRQSNVNRIIKFDDRKIVSTRIYNIGNGHRMKRLGANLHQHVKAVTATQKAHENLNKMNIEMSSCTW